MLVVQQSNLLTFTFPITSTAHPGTVAPVVPRGVGGHTVAVKDEALPLGGVVRVVGLVNVEVSSALDKVLVIIDLERNKTPYGGLAFTSELGVWQIRPAVPHVLLRVLPEARSVACILAVSKLWVKIASSLATEEQALARVLGTGMGNSVKVTVASIGVDNFQRSHKFLVGTVAKVVKVPKSLSRDWVFVWQTTATLPACRAAITAIAVVDTGWVHFIRAKDQARLYVQTSLGLKQVNAVTDIDLAGPVGCGSAWLILMESLSARGAFRATNGISYNHANAPVSGRAFAEEGTSGVSAHCVFVTVVVVVVGAWWISTLVNVVARSILVLAFTSCGVSRTADGAGNAQSAWLLANGDVGIIVATAILSYWVVARALMHALVLVQAGSVRITLVCAGGTVVEIESTSRTGPAVVAFTDPFVGSAINARAMHWIARIWVAVVHVCASVTITLPATEAAAFVATWDVHASSVHVALMGTHKAFVDIEVTVEISPSRDIAVACVGRLALVSAVTMLARVGGAVVDVLAEFHAVALETIVASTGVRTVNVVACGMRSTFMSEVGAFVDVEVALLVLVATVALASVVVDAKINAETVDTLANTIANICAISDTVTGETDVAPATVGTGGVCAGGKAVAWVISSGDIALVSVEVTVLVGPARLAFTMELVGASILTDTIQARTVFAAVVLSGVTVVNVLATFPVTRITTGRSDPSLPLTKTIAFETRVAHAVVRSRYINAGSIVVARMDTHTALVPVRTAGSTTPSWNTVTTKAKRTAVVAGTTVCARREFAIVGIDTSNAITSPASIAGALERTRRVCAERVRVTDVQRCLRLAVGGFLATFVFINLAVETSVAGNAVAGIAVHSEKGTIVPHLFAAWQAFNAGPAVFAWLSVTIDDIEATALGVRRSALLGVASVRLNGSPVVVA